jgi:hypothetical protein
MDVAAEKEAVLLFIQALEAYGVVVLREGVLP